MKGRVVFMVAALLASLAAGASAQTAIKVKPGVAPGHGTGGGGKAISGKVVTPKPGTSAQGKTSSSGK